jgi:acetyl esterase/lipase
MNKTFLKSTIFFIALLCYGFTSYSQTEVNLYDGVIPNERPGIDAKNAVITYPPYGRSYFTVVNPNIDLYLPEKEKNTGAAVIVCPGGAYFVEATATEGDSIAKRLCNAGVAGIVLNYRLPNPAYVENKEYVPLQDAQQAIILVRENAKKWGIDPNRIGILGSSAGGHLASTVGTHFQKCYVPNPNHIGVRPDFMILNYPVISMADSLTNLGTRYSLIGPGVQPGELENAWKDPKAAEERHRTYPYSKDKIKEFSNELHVTFNTPPTFITHSVDDTTANVKNSLLFMAALQNAGVKAGSFFYANGQHGYGIHNKTSDVQWIDVCINWLKTNGWLMKKEDVKN